ncbi:MAG: DNA/RNA non-specific endonuclease [Bacteroidales bacterium]|nr:DNA/RNA non-specific endonuclease [Bacteroidales bacterium]
MSRKKPIFGSWIVPVAVVAVIVWLAMRAWASNSTSQAPEQQLQGDFEKVITAPGLPEQIINYKGMTVSFNASTHNPNWVAWELTRDEAAGEEPRSNKFHADPDVHGCATPDDYRNSGFDRGHMAPAGDMKWSQKAMEESFTMTNICPQAKALNTGAWKKLEEKCRLWADRDSALVIVCGPVPGDPVDLYIGTSQVVVPQRFFKVILAPYANPPRGIGFIMPNERVEGGMQRAAVSIDEVERVTGHDFFSALPDSIENVIEAQCNFNLWSTLK